MPKFSFLIIAYNAQHSLPDLLRDLRKQDFDHREIEVLLINSNSTDHTQKLMETFALDNDFYHCQVLQNPKRVLAAGWNVALAQATGDIIVKIDAHGRIDADFLSNVYRNMEQGENIVGGQRPTVFDHTTHFSRVLSHAEASLFGSGIAVYRRSVKRQYVTSLAHAAYKKKVFDAVGGFNENLKRTEDNEIHFRMRQAGFRFCLCPDIISYQHARSKLSAMLKQKWGNGYWVGLTMGVCPKCFSLHNFIPFVFLLALLFCIIMGLWTPWLLVLLLAAYAAAATAFTIKEMLAEENETVRWMLLLLPVLFFLMHITYGAGTLIGLLKMPFWRKKHGN